MKLPKQNAKTYLKSGKSSSNLGYTLVEVMIFLAISGFMFVLAAVFITGKQAKADFAQGMNDTNEQVQQVINDVSNGFYPDPGQNFSCTAAPIQGRAPVITTGGSNGQGSRKTCVFLGKVLQFGVHGTDKRGYNTYTIAGRQYKIDAADGSLPESLADAAPVPVYSPVDLTDRNTFRGGIQVTNVVSIPNSAAPPVPLAGVGFFQSFSGHDASGTLLSGSQNVFVVGLQGTPTDVKETDMVNTNMSGPNNQITDANILPNPNIVICFEGGDGEFGTLTIGGGGGARLTTAVKINNTNTCP